MRGQGHPILQTLIDVVLQIYIYLFSTVSFIFIYSFVVLCGPRLVKLYIADLILVAWFLDGDDDVGEWVW